MSADIVKPKEELAPAPQQMPQRFNWQALSQWGCIGAALVIVLPLLLCAGVAGWLYFTTPTTSAAAPRQPVRVLRIPNCKQQGKRIYMQLGSGGKVIRYYCGGAQ